MRLLAEIAQSCNADSKTVEQIRKANTARHVQEIVIENKVDGFFDKVCSLVYKHMRAHSEQQVPIDVILFDFDGKVLGRHPV
jgi:cobalt-precorrin-5B (C1)-methyltransferase